MHLFRKDQVCSGWYSFSYMYLYRNNIFWFMLHKRKADVWGEGLWLIDKDLDQYFIWFSPG